MDKKNLSMSFIFFFGICLCECVGGGGGGRIPQVAPQPQRGRRTGKRGERRERRGHRGKSPIFIDKFVRAQRSRKGTFHAHLANKYRAPYGSLFYIHILWEKTNRTPLNTSSYFFLKKRHSSSSYYTVRYSGTESLELDKLPRNRLPNQIHTQKGI